MSIPTPRVQGPAVGAIVALLLLGCADPDDRPLGPGGGGDGPPSRADAGSPGNTAYGRVCEVESLADRAPCKPLLNSGLRVSTFSSFADLTEDGSFAVRISDVREGHVPVGVVSTNEWMGGVIWADAEVGMDLTSLEVPVMRREAIGEAIVQSGFDQAFGDAILAVQMTSFSGVPLEGVVFDTLQGESAMVGGPVAYQAGAATTSTGMAVYFGVAPGFDGLDINFNSGGMNYMTHGIVGADNFSILPVRLNP